jgi:glutamine phosphoribosylpyrophosphate amidotransferase
MVSSDGNVARLSRDTSAKYSSRRTARPPRTLCIGHVRYSTAGSISCASAAVPGRGRGQLALYHNGNLGCQSVAKNSS